MKAVYNLTKISLIVLFFVNTTQAAAPATVWYAGQLVLWDKMPLEGELSYNWSAEMVSLRQPDGRVRTFSAHQVSEFGWFDFSLQKYRTFVSLAKPVEKGRTDQGFFEICLDGPLTVVRQLRQRRGFLKTLFSHPTYTNDKPALAKSDEFFSYFVYDAGQLLKLDRYYIDIYEPLMMNYNREIRQYVLKHNINDRSLPGRLVLINHYNWLVQHDTKAASAKGVSLP
jgi:hypothetical protein